MNKFMVALVLAGVLAAPALAGSISGASYYDQYNILGWGTWRTLSDGSAVIDADSLQGQSANDFYDYIDLEVALEATERSDGDASLALAIASEEASRIAGDASTLAASEGYTDALQVDLEDGTILVGNSDKLDGWHLWQVKRFVRNRVAVETDRATAAEDALGDRIDDLETATGERFDALEGTVSDLSDAFNGLSGRVAALEVEVESIKGDLYEYAPIRNYNDFAGKCGAFILPRLNNEADKRAFDEEYRVLRDDRTRSALEGFIGDGNSGFTKQVCFDSIPSGYSGTDYNGDGSLSRDENNVWCVAYPGFASEREKYPCEVSIAFSNPVISNEKYVLVKEATGEPALLHVTPEDYRALELGLLPPSSSEGNAEFVQAYKCLATTGRRTC